MNTVKKEVILTQTLNYIQDGNGYREKKAKLCKKNKGHIGKEIEKLKLLTDI